MLPTIGLPNKKSTPEQQMAMMRTYLNQLKDDTESELYNIKWENLSKPLQEKLTAMDGDLAVVQENFSFVNANTVTTAYLEANYITATDIAATYVATSVLEADYITASQIASTYVATSYLTANYITASTIASNYVSTSYLEANYITASAIASTYVQASVVDAEYITGKFTSATTAWFDRINLGTLPYSNQNSPLRIHAGQGYANVYLQSTGTAHQYYLVVNMPD